MLGLSADATFEEVAAPDVIVFPGGVGTRPLEHDERVLEWVRRAHAGSRFTTSVCTGSIVLGAAGLLRGLTATTIGPATGSWPPTAPSPRPTRVVEHLDERIITAAGVSSGIDMALRLVELLADRTAAQAGPADDRVRPAAAVRLRIGGQSRRCRDDPCHRVRRTAGHANETVYPVAEGVTSRCRRAACPGAGRPRRRRSRV